MPKVFVSYCHAQRDWVWGRLVPVLKAAGAEVQIDVERFKAGISCYRQMDAEQDHADRQVLCFSDDYLKSAACDHEWRRAVQSDPIFTTGKLVPLVLTPGMTLPQEVKSPNPLYVDMRNDRDPAKWKLLLSSLGLSWPACAVNWLEAAETIHRKLSNNECVNLLVPRSASNGNRVVIDSQLQHLQQVTLPNELLPSMKVIDLHAGECATLRGLLSLILREAGCCQALPKTKREAVVEFSRLMGQLTAPLLLCLRSVDVIANAERQKEYGTNFFAALFDLTHAKQKLVLLAISHAPYLTLLPPDAQVSAINFTNFDLKVT